MTTKAADDKAIVNSAHYGLRRILGNAHLATRFTPEELAAFQSAAWTLGKIARELDTNAKGQGQRMECCNS